MGLSCKQDFWLINFPDLFCGTSIIPLSNMTIETQMNAMTRLIGIIYMVLLLTGFRYATLFFVASLFIIIVLYFIKRKKMQESYECYQSPKVDDAYKIEYYRPARNMKQTQVQQFNIADTAVAEVSQSPEHGFQLGTQNEVGLKLPSAYRFCNDQKAWDFNNPNYISENQRLVGNANPKTSIAPVIVPPLADLSYWKANNLVTHSAVNDETQFDAYQSGYQISQCCGSLIDKVLVPLQDPLSYAVPISDLPQDYSQPQPNFPMQYRNPDHEPAGGHGIGGRQRGGHQHGGHERGGHMYGDPVGEQFESKEEFDFPYLTTGPQVWPTEVMPEQPGQVNTACGYNPEQQFTASLPTNMAAGNCQQDPIMKQYNEDLYTQTIQPNVYARNQINEPINSNMGISFTQQYPPTTCSADMETGEVNFLLHDPRLLEPAIVEPNLALMDDVNLSNIYDPRHSGYGTSYRAYSDNDLGNTKFYYDDVDAIKMPNYITRSNIDFAPFADSYGPAPANGAWGNPDNSQIRALANDAFLRSSIEFRNDLTQRQMHKANVRQAQLRQAPMHTRGSGGSMSCGGGGMGGVGKAGSGGLL